MEEIFANQGLRLVADRICYFLSPKSFQSLILTSKFMMSYSANNFQIWFLKCQKAKLFTDKDLKKWKNFVTFLQEHGRDWNLGIISKFLIDNRNSKSSNIYHDLKKDPFKMVSFLGQIELLKLILEKSITASRMDLLPRRAFSDEGKKYFLDCISRCISNPMQGKVAKTVTFKAFASILEVYLKTDKCKIEQLVQVAKNSHSAEILKILAVCLNQPNTLGQTPMHMLAFCGNVKENIEVVKFAVSICDNLNSEDVFGTTPMHIAAEHGHLDFVKALIPCWNNPTAKNQDNKTAIEIAEDNQHHEIAKILKTRNQHELENRQIPDVYMNSNCK